MKLESRRQEAYKETVYQETPKHLEQKCVDDRSIQDNKEYSRMSPYDFKKPKRDDNTYYVMKVKNKWHAVALEYDQVKFLKNHIQKNIFNHPVNSEKLQEATKEIITYNLTNLENNHLLNIFTKR